MKATFYKKEKKYTIVSLITCICRGVVFLFICGAAGLAVGFIFSLTETKTYYSYQYTIESTVIVDDPSSSKYIRLLTSNKGISYLNEQINGNWECKDNPIISDNELFKSLSFIDLSTGTNNVSKFSISYKNSSKAIAFSSGKVIANASCTYLNQLYLSDTFRVINYPGQNDERITIEKPEYILLFGSSVGFFIGFCLSIFFDLFSNKFFGNGDFCKNEISSAYIIENNFKRFLNNCGDKKIYVLSDFEKEYLINHFVKTPINVNVVSEKCDVDGVILLLSGVSSFEQVNDIQIKDKKIMIYTLLLNNLFLYLIPFYKIKI